MGFGLLGPTEQPGGALLENSLLLQVEKLSLKEERTHPKPGDPPHAAAVFWKTVPGTPALPALGVRGRMPGARGTG